MAKQTLCDELERCRQRLPTHTYTDLGARGHCFRSTAERAETFYLTFQPPRQTAPAYRWVFRTQDQIFKTLDAMLNVRPLFIEAYACVDAMGGDATISRDIACEYALWIQKAYQQILLRHRPNAPPEYTYLESGIAIVSGLTLAEVFRPASSTPQPTHEIDEAKAGAFKELDDPDTLLNELEDRNFVPQSWDAPHESHPAQPSDTVLKGDPAGAAPNDHETDFDALPSFDGLFEEPE